MVLVFHNCCNFVRICVPAKVIGDIHHMYSKTYVKRPLKDRQNKDLNDNWLLMKVKSIAKVLQNAPLGAFCNTFDLHSATIGLENKFLIFLRVAALHRFYCNWHL